VSDSSDHRNRLADEPSLYLRQHGHNPVNWFPWAPEALNLARIEDKPILLSIGYSSCHWCHVMERESFEDERIARLMNELYVCIKVDREERPDLDNIYMKTVQMMTGHGGWPMTVFLRPDLKPFYAGTYYPPEDRGNMPGFPRVLVGVERAYREDAAKIGERADQVVALLEEGSKGRESSSQVSSLSICEVAAKLAGVMDAEEGGFGSNPKFPNTLALSFLLEAQRIDAQANHASLVKVALDKMAAGGIYDHLGGGFHRYSVDRYWLVPHFEKMLYDQALLADVYVEAWQRFGEPAYRDTLLGIGNYLCREMVGAGGGYFATQDADSEGVEGKFFVWTPDEVAAVVGEEDAELVCRYFDVTDEGNFEGKNILHPIIEIADLARMFDREPADVTRALAAASATMLLERAERIAPVTDEKHLADWNGLMIGAMAQAGAVLDVGEFVDSARAAADFVRAEMIVDGRLMHFYADGACRVPAFLDDYAFFGRGCLELFFAGGREADLQSATASADAILERYEDGAAGGFYFTAEDSDAPLMRSRELSDSAVPSGNAVATELLLRLWQLTGDDRYRLAGERSLEALLPAALTNPHGGGHLLNVALKHRRGYGVVVIAHADTRAGRELTRRARELPAPEISVLPIAGAEPDWLPAPVRGKTFGDQAAAHLCRGTTCMMPTSSADELELLMLAVETASPT
jgi:uncharacterized protein YyaL (SSP411 family)